MANLNRNSSNLLLFRAGLTIRILILAFFFCSKVCEDFPRFLLVTLYNSFSLCKVGCIFSLEKKFSILRLLLDRSQIETHKATCTGVLILVFLTNSLLARFFALILVFLFMVLKEVYSSKSLLTYQICPKKTFYEKKILSYLTA